MTNPCCMPLRRGVSIMAVIEIIFSVLRLILLIVAVSKYVKDTDNHDGDNDEEVAIGVGICVIILGIIGLFLSVRLYQGASQGNISYCRLWLIVKIIILVVDIILSLINGGAGRTEAGNLVVNILMLLYRLYMMYCVYCLIKELKLEQQSLGFQARMEDGMANAMPGGHGHQNMSYPQQPQPQPNLHNNANNAAAGDGYTYSINQEPNSNPSRQGYF